MRLCIAYYLSSMYVPDDHHIDDQVSRSLLHPQQLTRRKMLGTHEKVKKEGSIFIHFTFIEIEIY